MSVFVMVRERWDGRVKDTWRTDLELLEFAEDGVEGTEIGRFCWRGDKFNVGAVSSRGYENKNGSV